ncbi:MAG: hypothetical protein JWN11_746 [Hyphomicrobiales bacterium]|nr:hypothetical protein [Hyphomicrobiales bacterium]
MTMKRIIALGIVVFLVFAAWSGAWLFFAGEVKKTVLSLAEADGVTNPKLTCGTLNVNGFPFRFDAICADATLVSADISANVPELRATVLVYNPTHALIFAKAPLAITDAFTGSRRRLDWTNLEASARFDSWRIARVSVLGDNFELHDALAGDTLLGKAKHAEFHLIDIPERHDATKGLAALASYAKIDGLNAPGFQINNANTAFETDISGLPDDIRAIAFPEFVQRWQRAGGKLEHIKFSGDDGGSNFEVTGAMGLDDGGHPEGQLVATSKGVVERLGNLIPADVRPLLLGSPAADGTYKQTINIRAGVVFAGILPAASIPALF